MIWRPGDTVQGEFVTSRFDTGAATNADSTPTGTLQQNGSDTAVSVTITNVDAGRYKYSFVIPDTYLLGDNLALTIAATVNSAAGKGAVWQAVLTEQLVQRYSKATGGGANTVTLDAAASATDNLYVGSVIEIYSGTGAGQARVCTAYDGTTKVATVGRNWVINPAAGSLCAILGLSVPRVNDSLQVDTGLTVPTANENADALLKRDWTAVTGEAARSVLNALRAIRNKWSISGSTQTVYEEDDTTPAWTAALSSSASADPVTGSDPS